MTTETKTETTLRELYDEVGMVELLKSLMYVCELQAQYESAVDDDEVGMVFAAAWWKLSEALNGDPVAAATALRTEYENMIITITLREKQNDNQPRPIDR